MIVQMCGIKKYFGSGQTQVKALDGVDFEIEEGEFVAILGTSGSGKSTFLNLLGGLDKPSEGRVVVDNNILNKMTEDQITEFRRKRIGFVFQDYNLISVLSVYENIVLPIRLMVKKRIKHMLKKYYSDLNYNRKPQKVSFFWGFTNFICNFYR